MRAATDQIPGLKNTSEAAFRSKAKAEKALRKAAQKRRNHPQGAIETFIDRVYGRRVAFAPLRLVTALGSPRTNPSDRKAGAFDKRLVADLWNEAGKRGVISVAPTP